MQGWCPRAERKVLLPLLLALLSPRALGWASGEEGGGKEIVLPRGAVSKLSAPVTPRAEAHEAALGSTGGNRKYWVTSLRAQFVCPRPQSWRNFRHFGPYPVSGLQEVCECQQSRL